MFQPVTCNLKLRSAHADPPQLSSGYAGPDHAPTIEIDRNDTRSGYTMGGKVFAFGYMKGIMEALKLPYS